MNADRNVLDAAPAEAEVAELSLLLPRWQAIALQEEASERGLSIGQLLRRLISQALPREREVASLDGYWF